MFDSKIYFMTKQEFYSVKELFATQSMVSKYYDTLTEICDTYGITDLTLNQAREFMLDRIASLENDLEIALLVNKTDRYVDSNTGLSDEEMDKICKALDKFKKGVAVP